MDKKLGVYVCSGCSIGESIEVSALVKLAQSEFKAPVCRSHSCLCGDDALATVREDINSGAVNGLVIAACSPRAKTERFAFDSALPVERVNLREHVAWSHEPKDEDTQALAEDNLRIGITRAIKTEPLEALSDPIARTVLVVGGGVTGMQASLDAAAAGFDVLLVEKEARLGGFLANVKTRFPTRPPFVEASADGLSAQLEAVTRHPRIAVRCSTRIAKTEGQPGAFDVTLNTPEGAETTTHRVGAIVMATGWKPYDPSKLAGLGYGLPNVVTNVELETMAARGPIARASDGKPAKRVLFIQCAGSREAAHLAYCSSVCCMTTLKQVEYVRAQDPKAEVYVVYRDIVTSGQYEKYYQKVQDHPLNFFMKGQVTGVEAGLDSRVLVSFHGELLGKPMQVAADLVVLATGMVPNSADGPAIRQLHDAQAKVLRNESETQRTEAEKTVAQLQGYEGTEILNLTYRQGPDLPVLPDGFPDSRFVCFPYETQRTGIYTAGAVRAPMDASMAEEDAGGAVMKAIQCIEMASRGQAVHPRAGDLSYPSFLLQRCTQCKRCTEECPFGALDEDEKGTPKFNPYRCRRCGICLGACPERIVSFKNYSVDMIASMIKAIEVPDEFSEKQRILVLACENDAYPALDLSGYNRARYDASIRIVPLRCLGSLNIVWIADALARGIDGVLLLGCKFGDDYQCHFVRGSELANRRLENVKETLQRLQLESARIQLVQLAMDEYHRLPAVIDEFAAKIREIGPNPYKGF
jgi:quinone-modifying oxidoreductase subunit QmoB